MFAVAALNTPSKPSPRRSYRAEFDSLFRVAEHKADSALGITTYLEEMEKLNQDLKRDWQ